MSSSSASRSLGRGVQWLLVRVVALPFFLTLGAQFWWAYWAEQSLVPGWASWISHAWLLLLPLGWFLTLVWGWWRARQLVQAFDDLLEGQEAIMPGEFIGMGQHLHLLQQKLRQKEGLDARYERTLQRVETGHRLLHQLAAAGLEEVPLASWASNLSAALAPSLEVAFLGLWLQDGEEFAQAFPPGGEARRSFDNAGTCWVETDGNGRHRFILKVESANDDGIPERELPAPPRLVVELELASLAAALDEVRERLAGIAPLLAASWANWSLQQEMFLRIQMNRTVINSLEDGVLLFNRRLCLLHANQAAAQVLGLPVEQLADRSLQEMLPAPALGDWQEAYRNGQLPGSYATEIRRDGRPTVTARIYLYLSPFRLASPHGLALTVVVRDVTRQKELDDLRSDFTATLSHELRTPLTAMKGYLQTLMHPKARQFDMEKIQATVRIINGLADQLQRLIQELLEAAKIRSQDLDIRPQACDLTVLLKETLEENPNPKVQQSLTRSGPCLVYCDPERIRSVLDHLLSNAQKYSLPGGKVEMGWEFEGECIRAWVRDEGVGIPQDQQDRIFDMYHRLDTGNRRTHYGVGLGLYLAKKVIEGHGGDIRVESSPGCGSTFSFTLPRTAPAGETTQ